MTRAMALTGAAALAILSTAKADAQNCAYGGCGYGGYDGGGYVTAPADDFSDYDGGGYVDAAPVYAPPICYGSWRAGVPVRVCVTPLPY